MLKVGITGQAGFIGQHLYRTLSLYPEEFQVVPFGRSWFPDGDSLDRFVSSCDVIVHLAGINRHPSPEEIFEGNTSLSEKLVASCRRTKARPHILFSSSIQENRDNPYGRSKKNARSILAAWAAEAEATFSGLLIPNVFGPFGLPRYNSVVATFCHELATGGIPVIQTDSELGLIYVGELVEEMLGMIRKNFNAPEHLILPTATVTVSSLLKILTRFRAAYQENGTIPGFQDRFELNLFNTYRSYIPAAKYFPVRFLQHQDPRGAFVELIRLETGGQVSFSTTRPGITRGNHFHTRKIERFAVIRGEAQISLRKVGSEEVLNFSLSGEAPGYVDMPVWYTHNITNTGKEDLYTVFWINEPYDKADPDTYFMNV